MAYPVTVSDLMTTALLTVRPAEAVERADLDMKLASIHHIPVVDERNRLVGIVSDRDLLRALGRAERVVIGDVMTREVYTVGPDDPAADAVEQLIERGIGCLPVVGDEGELIGLITQTDFLSVAYKALAGEPIER